MRVLIVSQYFFPENFPINHVARILSENKFEVDILTGKPNYPEGEFYEGYKFFGTSNETYNKDINIFRVPIFKRSKKPSKITLTLNYLSFIFFAILLSPKILRKKKYDFVFVCCYSPLIQAIVGLFVSRYKKIPLYIWIQDLWPESISSTGFIKNKLSLMAINIIVSKIYKSSDKVFTQSISMQKHIIENYDVDPKKVLYLPNALDSEILDIDYEGDKIPDKLVPHINKFNILFAGNIGKAQSFDTILKTAKYLKNKKNINFIILGTGSDFKKVEKAILANNLNNIHLIGHISHRFVKNFINHSDALLISLSNSQIFSKTIPSKLQLYLASSKPIIGSLNGEAASIITKSGSGYVSNAEDAEELAKNCEIISNMSKCQLQSMGNNGLNYFNKNFSDKVFINTFIKLVNSTYNTDI